jgi:hypothetical protein
VGPLTGVLFLGAGLSCVLLGLSIYYRDGMSLLATALLSMLSTLIGWGNHWTLQLPKREEKAAKVPNGDVVIRYLKGSFLVIRCDEDVARELYFAPEAIKYTLDNAPAYRMLSLLGTLMLMGGVIALANSLPKLQIAWAASYMLLNAAYWTVAALPSKLHWDTSCFEVTMEALSDSDPTCKGYPSLNKTFTQALWKVLVLTKSVGWTRRGDAAPNTKAWTSWMNDAKFKAESVHQADKPLIPGVVTWQVPEWDPQTHLRELMEVQRVEEEKGIEEV